MGPCSSSGGPEGLGGRYFGSSQGSDSVTGEVVVVAESGS